jgi:hypothetical protein
MKKVQRVAGCYQGNCPEVFVVDGGEVVIKGNVITTDVREQVKFSTGEDAVAIPGGLLLRSAAAVLFRQLDPRKLLAAIGRKVSKA